MAHHKLVQLANYIRRGAKKTPQVFGAYKRKIYDPERGCNKFGTCALSAAYVGAFKRLPSSYNISFEINAVAKVLGWNTLPTVRYSATKDSRSDDYRHHNNYNHGGYHCH